MEKKYSFDGKTYKVTDVQEIFSMFYQYSVIVNGIVLGILTGTLREWNGFLKPLIIIISSATSSIIFGCVSLFLFDRNVHKNIIDDICES